MSKIGRFATVLGVLSAAALAGCSILKPHSDTAKYYVLAAQGPGAPAASAPSSVGVAKITMPEYLNRSDMVTRSASNQLAVSPFEMWGEPLRDGFNRTLSADLASLLGADRVIAAPWDAPHPPDLSVEVEVRRFECVGGARVELDAVWNLREGKGGAPVATRQSTLRRPVDGAGTEAAVVALSQTVADLAREIAGAVRLGPAPQARSATGR